MIEKKFILDSVDPTAFYGVGNANLILLRSLFPRLRIMARDNIIRVLGDIEMMADFEDIFNLLLKKCQHCNLLKETDILHCVNHQRDFNTQTDHDVIVFSTGGKPIAPRSENQRRMVEAFDKSDLLFAVGPAGSGKTFLAIALAVRALKNKSIRRIILSRPAVEAGEKLGFLPGDMKEKIDPYLQPLYDALQEMIPANRLQDLISTNVIEIAPLAFMRGRTLNEAIVILDEAQNTTTAQLKMFLTRMGKDTKMIVTGDLTQVDLPTAHKSGLRESERILRNIPGITHIQMTQDDIVRHKLVTRIVEAYNKEEERMQKRKDK